MTAVVAGAASSHALALTPPEAWDRIREGNRGLYVRRWGDLPQEHPNIANETLEGNTQRYQHIQSAFDAIGQTLEDLSPDVFLILGDDQHEHFSDIVPQMAIYTGDSLTISSRGAGDEIETASPSLLAKHLLKVAVEADFDVAEVKKLPNNVMFSHALAGIVQYFHPKMPVLPIWINCIAPPAPSPARCRAFGEILRVGLDSFQGFESAFVYASGGLSHFTAGYPYDDMDDREAYGSIHEGFDKVVVEAVREGRGAELARYTSKDFLDHGEVETCQWVTLLGLLRDAKPDFVEYEAFYRGIMGMGVALWKKPTE